MFAPSLERGCEGAWFRATTRTSPRLGPQKSRSTFGQGHTRARSTLVQVAPSHIADALESGKSRAELGLRTDAARQTLADRSSRDVRPGSRGGADEAYGAAIGRAGEARARGSRLRRVARCHAALSRARLPAVPRRSHG